VPNTKSHALGRDSPCVRAGDIRPSAERAGRAHHDAHLRDTGPPSRLLPDLVAPQSRRSQLAVEPRADLSGDVERRIEICRLPSGNSRCTPQDEAPAETRSRTSSPVLLALVHQAAR